MYARGLPPENERRSLGLYSRLPIPGGGVGPQMIRLRKIKKKSPWMLENVVTSMKKKRPRDEKNGRVMNKTGRMMKKTGRVMKKPVA